jgi:hypothetical protein
VASDVVVGAISGVAAGIGAVVETLQVATAIVKVADVVAQTVLETTGEVVRQVIVDGKVDDPVSIIVAGAGTALGGALGHGVKAIKAAVKAARAAKKAEQVAEELEQVVAKVDDLSSVSKTVKGAAGKADLAPGSLGKWKEVATPIGPARFQKLALTRKALEADDAVLRSLALKSGPTRLAGDAADAAADFSVIPDKFYVPKAFADERLPKGLRDALRKMFGSSEKADERLASDFRKVAFKDPGVNERTGKRILNRFENEVVRLKKSASDLRALNDDPDLKLTQAEKAANLAEADKIERAMKSSSVFGVLGYVDVKSFDKSEAIESKLTKVGFLAGEDEKPDRVDFKIINQTLRGQIEGRAEGQILREGGDKEFLKLYKQKFLNLETAEKVKKAADKDYTIDLNEVKRWANSEALTQWKKGKSAEILKPLEDEAKIRAGEVRKAFDSYIRVATRGYKEMEGHYGTVYRKLNLTPEQFTASFETENGIYLEKGFASTATERSGTSKFNGNVMLVINSRGGAKGIAHIAQNASEKEATFVPGTRLKVLKIETRLDSDQKPLKIVFLDEVLGKLGAT